MGSVFTTRLTKALGIEHPIIMGGMLRLGLADLAAAVSNAGGLGIITSLTFSTKESFRDEVRKLKSLTDKPFGVNLNLMPRTALVPTEEYIRICIAEGVPVVETSGRSPDEHIPLLKAAGIKVLHKVPGARYAKTAERLGCDAVAVVGHECGGHPGLTDVGTLVMVRQAVQSVSIPVIAAGGFADGSGLVAALALGAESILMGTRFMATQESSLHPNAKHWMLNASEEETAVVQRSIKSPTRVAKNGLAETILSMEQQGASVQELMPFITGSRASLAYFEGKIDDGLWCCGQTVGLVKDVPTCRELIDRIMAEARMTVGRLSGLMSTQ